MSRIARIAAIGLIASGPVCSGGGRGPDAPTGLGPPPALQPLARAADFDADPALLRAIGDLEPEADPSVADMLHALALLGPEARFRSRRGETASILGTLLDADAFRDLTGRRPPLVRTEHGARFLQLDASWAAAGRIDGEGHPGQALATFARLGLPLETVVRLPGRKPGTLRLILDDLVATFSLSGEIDWAAEALALYLPPDRTWTNREGRTFSLDELCDELLGRDASDSTCSGTHRLIALALLLRVGEEEQVLSPWTCQRIRDELGGVARHLEHGQAADGSWDLRWGDPPARRAAPGGDLNSRLLATGHHLEWLLLLPDDLGPGGSMCSRAAGYLRETLPGFVPPGGLSGRDYCTAVHAARGACSGPKILTGRTSPGERPAGRRPMDPRQGRDHPEASRPWSAIRR
jgi:hypothetical protein